MAQAQSDFERLERLLRESEIAREAADLRTEEAQRRIEEAERQIRLSTLDEYLKLCHQHCFQSLSVETNPHFTTTGKLTNPKGKRYPKRLRPWANFVDEQAAIFQRLHAVYPRKDGPREFEAAISVRDQGLRLKRPIGNEVNLQFFERVTIETPATLIVEHLREVDDVRREFKLGGSVVFDNEPQALSDRSEEVIERQIEQTLPSTPGPGAAVARPSRTDQVCVYSEVARDATHRRLIFIIEYKPPHKLTLANLRAGLHPMTLREDVIDRVTIPASTDVVANFEYQSDRLVAAAVTQLFSYMIQGGVRYGYIATGQAFVFLRIPADDPSTVEYHFANPEADVAAQMAAYPDEDYSHQTALAQVVAFTLLALGPKPSSNAWRARALAMATPWMIDYNTILHAIPPSTQRSPPPTSVYVPRPYRVVFRSPIVLRWNRGGCRPPSVDADGSNEAQDSDSEDDAAPHTPTPSVNVRPNQAQPAPARERDSNRSRGGRQHRAYCTHACLLGLLRTGLLDSLCPNISSHQGHNARHSITLDSFHTLLGDQFTQTLDTDCDKLGVSGARGALFRVTLASYGYTLVAKGTVSVFVEDLQHEMKMYQHLVHLQGTQVPVCLGNLDLTTPYYYDAGIEIVHMMLLSWAGKPINVVCPAFEDATNKVKWRSRQVEAFSKIKDAGIQHNDERWPNVLWDERLHTMMVVDFERARLIATALSSSSGNKRKREEKTGTKAKIRNAHCVAHVH